MSEQEMKEQLVAAGCDDDAVAQIIDARRKLSDEEAQLIAENIAQWENRHSEPPSTQVQGNKLE